MADAPVRPPAYVPGTPSDTDTDVVITQPTVNVGEFGWTTNDLTSVKDIVRYVATAQAAAASAEANAIYVSAQMDKLDAGVAEVESIQQSVTATSNDINVKYQQILTANADSQTYAANAKGYSDSASQSAAAAAASEAVVKTYALAALYSYFDQGVVTSATATVTATNGTVQRLRLSVPTTDIYLKPFSTDPDNTVRQLTLIIEQGTGSNLITFTPRVDPDDATKQINVVHWNNDRPPRLSYEIDKADIVTLLSHDKGKTWFGFFNGGWFNIA